MNKNKLSRIFGLLATGSFAIAAVSAGVYTTATGLVGSAVADMTTTPAAQGG